MVVAGKAGKAARATVRSLFGRTKHVRSAASAGRAAVAGRARMASQAMPNLFSDDRQSNRLQLELDEDGFRLPPKERASVLKMIEELNASKKWGCFDGFFGCVLLLSCVCMGMIIVDSERAAMWGAIDDAALFIFALEILLRFYFVEKRWYMLLLTDPWTTYDVVVVTVLVLMQMETWFVGALCTGNKCSMVIFFRLIRLLRLIKLLRLLRMFETLWMFVEGVLLSLRALASLFIILIIILSMGATSMVRLVSWASTSPHGGEAARLELEAWPDVVQSMWNMVGMMTLDGWIQHVRTFFFDFDGAYAIVLSLTALAFVVFAALGVMNVVTAVMCNAAFEMSKTRQQRRSVAQLLQQRRALVRLEDVLRSSGERPLLQSTSYMSLDEFFALLSDGEVRELVDCLCLDTKDLIDLMRVFDVRGEFEIAGVSEAVGTVVLQRYSRAGREDLTRGPDSGSTLRAQDMIYLNHALGSIEQTTEKADAQVKVLTAFLQDFLGVLEDKATEQQPDLVPQKKFMNSHHSSFGPQYGSLASLSAEYFREYLDDVDHADLEVRILSRMDAVFGAIMMLNAVFLIAQAEGDTLAAESLVSLVLDQVFTVIFLIEFLLRSTLDAVLSDFKARGAWDEMARLKETMPLGIFPPCPPGGVRAVLRNLPQLLKNPLMMLDLFLVILASADSWCLVWLRRNGSMGLDPSTLFLFRLLRFARSLKMLRIFKLFPMLQIIVNTLITSPLQWAAALFAQGLVVYVSALMLTYWLGGNVWDEDSRAFYFFGSFERNLMTCWQLSTLDGWAEIFDELSALAPELVPFFALFMFFVGVGIMNLVVGFIAESAVGMLANVKAHEDFLQHMKFLRTLEDVRVILEQRMFLTSVTVDLLDDVTAPDCPKSDGALADLWAAFQELGLSSTAIRQVFKRLDYMRTGELPIDAFIQGCKETKDNLAKVNIYAVSRILARMWKLTTSIRKRVHQCHNSVTKLLVCMDALLQEKHLPKIIEEVDVFEIPEDTFDTADLRFLTSTGEAALKDVISHLSDEDVEQLTVLRGSGRVSWNKDAAEMLQGQDTRFKDELKVGDFLIIQGLGPQNTTLGDWNTSLSVVKRIDGHTQVKVSLLSGNSHLSHAKQYSFVIARHCSSSKEEQEAHEREMIENELYRARTLTPRTEQRLLDWSIGSAKDRSESVSDLEHANEMLSAEVAELLDELLVARMQMLLRRAMEGFIMNTLLKRSPSRKGTRRALPAAPLPVETPVTENDAGALSIPTGAPTLTSSAVVASGMDENGILLDDSRDNVSGESPCACAPATSSQGEPLPNVSRWAASPDEQNQQGLSTLFQPPWESGVAGLPDVPMSSNFSEVDASRTGPATAYTEPASFSESRLEEKQPSTTTETTPFACASEALPNPLGPTAALRAFSRRRKNAETIRRVANLPKANMV